jgi:hypothetical protein
MVAVVPRQTLPVLPNIAGGVGFTVTVRKLVHPLGNVYVILDVPTVRAVIAPVEEPIDATDVLLLLHVPPVSLLLSVVVKPVHKVAEPVIAGAVVTVIIVETAVTQPAPDVTVYVMFVVPAARPTTIPEVIPIEATDVLLLIHAPPVVVFVSVVVNPAHMFDAPEIAGTIGRALTVNVFVAMVVQLNSFVTL